MKFALNNKLQSFFYVSWSGVEWHTILSTRKFNLQVVVEKCCFSNFSQLREMLSSEGVTDENKELLDVSQTSWHFNG